MNKDILHFEEIVLEQLPQTLVRFIFDGLSDFISRAICFSLQYIRKINQYGIMKTSRNLFALQQNLANISVVGDSHLSIARQYISLFDCDIDVRKKKNAN